MYSFNGSRDVLPISNAERPAPRTNYMPKYQAGACMIYSGASRLMNIWYTCKYMHLIYLFIYFCYDPAGGGQLALLLSPILLCVLSCICGCLCACMGCEEGEY